MTSRDSHSAGGTEESQLCKDDSPLEEDQIYLSHALNAHNPARRHTSMSSAYSRSSAQRAAPNGGSPFDLDSDDMLEPLTVDVNVDGALLQTLSLDPSKRKSRDNLPIWTTFLQAMLVFLYAVYVWLPEHNPILPPWFSYLPSKIIVPRCFVCADQRHHAVHILSPQKEPPAWIFKILPKNQPFATNTFFHPVHRQRVEHAALGLVN